MRDEWMRSGLRPRWLAATVAWSLLLVLCAAGEALTVDAAAIDAWVEDQMARHGIPGVAVSVTLEGETVFARGYGTAGGGRPLTEDTPMFIGSTSKAFTGLAVMQLAERGLIDLEAPVRTYLPWFELADEAAASAITVRHLLGHSSGLSDLQYVDTWRIPADASLEVGVRDLRRARPIDPPGTAFHYFNPGYATLGAIVEAVSGQAYGDYLREHIFEPLGMERTFTDPTAAHTAGLASGHALMFGFPVEMSQPFRRYALPAGYLMSTANDMARFLGAMANRGELDGVRVLSVRGMLELQRPREPSGFYAMGWFVGDHRGMRLIQHGGANEFFKSEAMILPDRDLGVSVLIDQGYLPSAFHGYPQLAYGLLDIAAGLQPGDPGWPIRWLGFGLAGILGVQIVLGARALVRLRSWRDRAARWRPPRRWLDVALHFVVVPVIAVAIIWFMREWMGRGTSLRGAFAAVPDAALLALLAYGLDLAQGTYKLLAILRGGRGSRITDVRRRQPERPRRRVPDPPVLH